MAKFNVKRAEIANTITHGIVFLFYCIASFMILRKGGEYNNFILDFSLVVYIISQLLIFFSSTFYHAITNKK